MALIVTDITNPYFTLVARGAEDVAGDSNYAVVYCNTDESETKEEKYANILAQRRVDGVLLVPAGGNSKTIKFLASNDIAVVVLDRRVAGVKTDFVRSDSGKRRQSFDKIADRIGAQTDCDDYRPQEGFYCS